MPAESANSPIRYSWAAPNVRELEVLVEQAVLVGVLDEITELLVGQLRLADHYDHQTLRQLAGRFYRQAVEERNHAMMIVQYLLDSGASPVIPSVGAPRTTFEDDRAPVALARDQEKHVTEQIARLVAVARDEHDFVGEQFLGWFLAEQREEVARASALLAVIDRAGVDNMLLVEAYLVQASTAAAEPSGVAPPIAGGAL